MPEMVVVRVGTLRIEVERETFYRICEIAYYRLITIKSVEGARMRTLDRETLSAVIDLMAAIAGPRIL